MAVALVAVAAAVLVACSAGDDEASAPPRPEPVVAPGGTVGPEGDVREPDEGPATTTAAPTTVVVPVPAGVVVPPGRPAVGGCPEIPAAAPPDPDRPSYLMDVFVEPADGVVEGRLTVRFTPDLPTDRLVFRLWPNGPRGADAGTRLEVAQVFLGSNAPVAVERPDPTTLVVPLGTELAAGQRVEATVVWTLTLPGATNDRVANEGGAVRLGSFFPILAWEPGVGWALDPPTAALAETSTAPVADFSYAVNVPEGDEVMASGTLDRGRWVATAHRDVAVTVGRFRTAVGQAGAPHPVEVTVGVHEGVEGDPAAYLDRVVRSLTDFALRYGPYPYRSFSVSITPGLTGGIEYPSHVMQGPGSIGRSTPHEVAHQWFHGLVGNDQGRDPWLDEALASWAEARFEGTLDDFATKEIPGEVVGRTGEPMTWWADHPDAYYRGVYVQGALALAALGPPDLVDCALRHYVADQAFAVATPLDLVDSVTAVFPDARTVLEGSGTVG